MQTCAPKVMIFKNNDMRVISVRKFIDLDIVTAPTFILVQWGKTPVKFLCLLKKNRNPPSFLLSIRWHIKVSIGRIRAGYTRKPLDLSTFWRKQCEILAGLDLSQHTATKIRSTHSAIGPATAAEE